MDGTPVNINREAHSDYLRGKNLPFGKLSLRQLEKMGKPGIHSRGEKRKEELTKEKNKHAEKKKTLKKEKTTKTSTCRPRNTCNGPLEKLSARPENRRKGLYCEKEFDASHLSRSVKKGTLWKIWRIRSGGREKGGKKKGPLTYYPGSGTGR